MTTDQPPFQPGETFVWKKQTYKVMSVSRDRYHPDDWMVAAWRFIKTTQKFSGNAYLYLASHILSGSR